MAPRKPKPGDTTDLVLPDAYAPTRVQSHLKALDDDTAPSYPGIARDPLLHAKVSGYQIDGLLGRGAAGIVYQAVQLKTGKRAAFKVLKPEFAEQPEYILRLIEEAKALSSLRHPGIIDILDFGLLPNGQPYLVMELFDGISLEEQLQFGGKPTMRETLNLLDELLGALGAAHDHGIIHRDVKPSNLFLATLPDGKRHLKVLDFGLARVSDRRTEVRPTRPGSIVGTPDYMSPEQIVGRDVSAASDVYATGGIAFRLLCDRLPFVGASAFEVITIKMEGQPPRLREVDPKVPPELDLLVFQMMSLDPPRRPSVKEARARFTAFLKTLDRGPTINLDESASLRPTTFHQFDDRGAVRRARPSLPAPQLSPPSRPTDLEKKHSIPKTELESAFVPQVPDNKLRNLGVVLVVLGLGGALIWYVLHR